MSDAPETTGRVREARQPSAARIITAACIGNALEWYDIAVYSYFAVYVAKVFFPSGDETVGLLLALGTFAVSFLIRPIGALVLGSYADRAGRKPALTL
jgi:MFS transporter, MHS family, proline/betaine transporter